MKNWPISPVAPWCFFLLLSSACASGPAETPSASGEISAPGGMVGLAEAPWRARWDEWTPDDGPADPVGAEGFYAFDYWQIDQPRVVEKVWTGFFALLSGIRGQEVLNEDQRLTVRMLMSELEPKPEADVRLDVSFVVRAPDQEGILIRMFRKLPNGAVPGITILAQRPSGKALELIDAWLFSGHTETPSLSVAVRRSQGDQWAMGVAPGLHFVDRTPISDSSADLVGTILREQVWKDFTGKAYVEASEMLGGREWELPRPFPKASNLPIRDRDIDHVFSDSVFPPRMTGF